MCPFRGAALVKKLLTLVAFDPVVVLEISGVVETTLPLGGDGVDWSIISCDA